MLNHPKSPPFSKSQKPSIVRLLTNVTFNISFSSNRLRVCVKGKSRLVLRLLLINSLFIHYDDNELLVTRKSMPNIWLSFNKRIVLLFRISIPYVSDVSSMVIIISFSPFGWSKNVRNSPWMVVQIFEWIENVF